MHHLLPVAPDRLQPGPPEQQAPMKVQARCLPVHAGLPWSPLLTCHTQPHAQARPHARLCAWGLHAGKGGALGLVEGCVGRPLLKPLRSSLHWLQCACEA